MIVPVVGMHRSGTSAVAGILHLNGVLMGSEKTFRPKPLPQNPKGFYENFDFRKVNDMILSHRNYDVKSYSLDIPDVEATGRLKRKMRNLLLKYSTNYQSWGWKDPRTCLTLNLWLDELKGLGLLTETRILLVVRNEFSVARSLYRRNELPHEVGLKLWMSYYMRALEAADRYNVRVMYYRYEDLVNDSVESCRSIFASLGRPFDEKVVSRFVDPKLDRNREIPDGENLQIPVLDDVVQFRNRLYSRFS
jgi:hypothetical protein